MERLYEMIFSENENIMYEIYDGNGIISRTRGEVRAEIEGKAALLAHRLENLQHDNNQQYADYWHGRQQETDQEGMPSGRVVGLCMESGPEWLEMFWAILRCGCDVLLLNPWYDTGILEKAAAACRVEAIISEKTVFSIPTVKYSSCLGAEYAEVKDKSISVSPVSTVPKNTKDCHKTVNFGNKVYFVFSDDPDAFRICGYSGGELLYQAQNISRIFSIGEIKKKFPADRKNLILYPYYHVFGLSACFSALIGSQILVSAKEMKPQGVPGLIKMHGVTHVFAPPSFWEKLFRFIELKVKRQAGKAYLQFKHNLQKIQKLSGFTLIRKFLAKRLFGQLKPKLFGNSFGCMITGIGIRHQVLDFFDALGCFQMCVYGNAETGIISAETNKKQGRLTDGFIGAPNDIAEFSVDGNDRLMVRSSQTASLLCENGAWKAPDRTEWVITDDLAECVGGCYRVLGSIDDMITESTGKKLNPDSIENGFIIDGVRDLCLVEARVKEKKAPVLIVSVENDISPEEYVEMCKSVHEHILKGGMGSELKDILYTGDELLDVCDLCHSRKKIRRNYEKRRFSPILSVRDESSQMSDLQKDSIGTALTVDVIRAVRIREIAAAVFGVPKNLIDYDTDFLSELEAASMDIFSFLCEIEEEFHVTLNDETARELRTVRKICDFLEKKSK